MFVLAILSGCQHFGYVAKRESELNCPTDIRQTIPWCAGEDAIFHCPCGPSSDFHGYKPTCWGVWPAPGAQWRDAFCGPLARDHGGPCESCQGRSCQCEPTDPALVELPPLPAKPQQSDSAEEVHLGNPASSEKDVLPQRSEDENKEALEDEPVLLNDSHSEEPHYDPAIQSAGLDYTLPHETQTLSIQSVRNSPDPLELETPSSSERPAVAQQKHENDTATQASSPKQRPFQFMPNLSQLAPEFVR